jgi:hypothetical protein
MIVVQGAVRNTRLPAAQETRLESNDRLGPRASRPQMSAKRENEFGSPKDCAFGAFAGGTAAVPANRLSDFSWVPNYVSFLTS